jgi:hypothetical protein
MLIAGILIGLVVIVLLVIEFVTAPVDDTYD